ncbi:DUF5689 domain-containing protein [Pedobacter metabolipauper]|uniref:DUF5689 domain-containing protein n=1 Tax=Pedobacter metabolipauper TaxID=425513 RepID=A0A4R6SV55_9SPHI|nr:DUF5689 domain-containing protein [Pedobacter metabolipauper]TDQ07637.1 hypothetical protein ATK78_3765 [Pedobacter metabolipauper]
MKKIYSILAVLIIFGMVLNACKKDVNPSLGTQNPFAALYVVKNLYKGSDVQLDPSALGGANLTGGVVISNLIGKNFPNGGLIIQNANRGQIRGILIELGDAAIPFVPGDSLVVDVTGGTLTKVGNSLHLKGLSLASIKKISSNNVLTPRTVALGALAADFGLYENTLLKLTADTKPLPLTGETYAGNKFLDDGSSSIALYTQADALFAGNSLPASATYTVIPVYGNETGGYGSVQQVRIRTEADVENASGPIYPNWPESFESPDATFKPSYNMNTTAVPDNNVELKTGSWKLFQSILANTAGRDRINAPGAQAIRMQQNLSVPAFVQMNFDLQNGASKVTLWHGAYYTDAISTFRLEYSTDGGTTWLAAGADVKCASGGSKQETFLLNIKGKVRFRVNKLGLGTTSVPNILNGRMSVEDIAIYSN